MAPLALEKGSLVLVTGSNGYIASHICNELLENGYRVRGTVRDMKKADWMVELFSKQYGDKAFEPVEVKDMSDVSAFDEVMKDCAGVVHVASILSFDPDPNKVIPKVKAGATNILEAAAKHPSVKRVVYTSSSTACTLPKPNKEFSFGPETWNQETIDLAWAPPPYKEDRGFAVYGASKTEAEQACWAFMKKEKPGFVLNCVLPNMNMGTILHPSQPASTAGGVRGLWNGEKQGIDFMKMLGPQYMIDVKDDARLHVGALIYEDIKDERLLGFAAPVNFNKMVKAMHEIDSKRELPDLIEGEGEDKSKPQQEKSIEVLGRFGQHGWTDFETSLRRNVGVA